MGDGLRTRAPGCRGWQSAPHGHCSWPWLPAFAGMTEAVSGDGNSFRRLRPVRGAARRGPSQRCRCRRNRGDGHEPETPGLSHHPAPRATQKGPGIAARPRVAGLLPWIRTDRRHGFGGILGARRQGHACLGSVVEAGRCPLTPKGSCGYQPRRPASSLRPGAGNRKPCWMLLSARSLQILPHRLRVASGWPISRRIVPSFPKPGACAPLSANQGSDPFPLRPSASCNACASPSASGRTVLRRPSKPRQRLGGTSASQLPGPRIPEP